MANITYRKGDKVISGYARGVMLDVDSAGFVVKWPDGNTESYTWREADEEDFSYQQR
jgi:hypothetical protein